MNANNPKAPPPRPRAGPFCPNCLRGEGKHFPACPLESPRRLALEGSQLVERSRATGAVLARHDLPVDVLRPGCKLCGGTGGH